MTGVDILAMEEVAVEFAFNWTVFWVMVVGAGVIGLVYSIYMVVEVDEWTIIPLTTTGFILVGIIIGCLGATLFNTPTKYAPQYKVTISDEVSMTEFLEKYEIIETEGKIYTVREKK